MCWCRCFSCCCCLILLLLLLLLLFPSLMIVFFFFSLVLTSARTEVLVSCIRGCGAVIKRCTLAEHMKGECLHESVPCPLGAGCSALVMRKDLDRHCAEKEHETSLVKEVT